MSRQTHPIDYRPLVTAVIVTYRSHALLEAMCTTLRCFDHAVVVDNASGDGLLDELRGRFPEAHLPPGGIASPESIRAPGSGHAGLRDLQCVASPVNMGYGAGNNLGIRHVRTPYALILNPDARITEADIAALVAAAEQFPQSAIVGARIETDLGVAETSYDWTYLPEPPLRPYVEPQGLLSTRWLYGCCLLVRRKAFDALGGFDERFFMYYEEYDLCGRAVDAGFDVLLEPAARVVHRASSSSAPSLRTRFLKDLHWSRSKRRYMEKLGLVSRRPVRAVLRSLTLLAAGLLYFTLLQGRRGMKMLARAAAEMD
jgi:N-acetylglucosaminyl-diphospho-decaprenol L-rhamnosyltransferase